MPRVLPRQHFPILAVESHTNALSRSVVSPCYLCCSSYLCAPPKAQALYGGVNHISFIHQLPDTAHRNTAAVTTHPRAEGGHRFLLFLVPSRRWSCQVI